jgi:hypothetical protein
VVIVERSIPRMRELDRRRAKIPTVLDRIHSEQLKSFQFFRERIRRTEIRFVGESS